MQLWTGCTGHLVERLRNHVCSVRELRKAELIGLNGHLFDLVGGNTAQDRLCVLAGGDDDDQVAEVLQEVFDEAARILSGLNDAIHSLKNGSRVALGEGINDFIQQFGMSKTKQRSRQLVFDLAAVRAGNQLIQQRKRVSNRAAAGANHECQYARRNLHILRLTNRLEVFQQLSRRNQAERVVVGARPDGADDLLWLGGGEDEFHVGRWFFNDLQQRVEALGGDHVGLIQDEDLVAVARGGEDGALSQIARVVYAVVRSSVDLDYIERTATVAREIHAARTNATGGIGWALKAVEAARQNAGRGGLAATARTTEKVGMIDAIITQRCHERSGDLRLTD